MSYLSEKQRTKYKYTVSEDYAKGLRRKYGLSLDDFWLMFKAQLGSCAICYIRFNSKVRASVDHNHVTSRYRSLLCLSCNTGLGNFKDNPELLRLAATYLETHRDMLEL